LFDAADDVFIGVYVRCGNPWKHDQQADNEREESGEARERLRRIAIVDEIRHVERRAVAARLIGPYPEQLLDVAVRQLPQQDGVDDAEDRRRCPHSQGNGQHGSGCERRRFAKRAQAVADVAHQGRHGRLPDADASIGATDPLDLLHVVQIVSGGHPDNVFNRFLPALGMHPVVPPLLGRQRLEHGHDRQPPGSLSSGARPNMRLEHRFPPRTAARRNH